MKHHSQRSKRPPSRTLAPRILAALTAGAFTLGGMPHGFAADHDVVSTVTTDILANDGVASITDSTASTITVGTEGGEESPEIYYLASGHHRPRSSQARGGRSARPTARCNRPYSCALFL